MKASSCAIWFGGCEAHDSCCDEHANTHTYIHTENRVLQALKAPCTESVLLIHDEAPGS